MSARVNIAGFGAVLVAACLSTGAAMAADDCKPQRIVASVDLVPSADGRELFVPVKINGTPKLMLLDTGAVMAEIMPGVADELHLTREKGNLELVDLGGQTSRDVVRAQVELGGLTAAHMIMGVEPAVGHDHGVPGYAGLFGPDVLRNFDVDVDFGTNKLNLISPDHCPGKVIYWPASAVAVVPMRVLDSGHIVVPITLEGKQIFADLDTGAPNTTLSVGVAQSDFGVVPGSADTPQGGTVGMMKGAPYYEHVFGTLAFEGIAVSNAHVDLITDMTHDLREEVSAPNFATRIRSATQDEARWSMLIGMNILRHFHLYISYKEEKLYVTPAGSPSAGH